MYCREDKNGQWQRIEDMGLANPRQWMEETYKKLYKKEGIAVVQDSGVFGLNAAEAEDDSFKEKREEIDQAFKKHFRRNKK